jgi:cobalamin biosynthesis protein CobT
MRAAAPKLGSIQRCASSGNPDFSALMFTIEEIKTQKEQRKIIFFITDTGSYIPSQMSHVQKVAEKLDITIIAIGVGTYGIREMFKHGVDVHETRDMGGATFTTLLKTLRSKD